MKYYHGTNSKFMSDRVRGGRFMPDQIWVGFNPDYCAERAIKKAAEYHSRPVILLFDERHPKKRIEPLENHQLLSGCFNLDELVFLSRSDEDGLYEIARSNPGAVLTPSELRERRIIRPSVEDIIRYVRSEAQSSEEPDEQYLRALELKYDWDGEAVEDLRIAAAKGDPSRIDEIVERATRIR